MQASSFNSVDGNVNLALDTSSESPFFGTSSHFPHVSAVYNQQGLNALEFGQAPAGYPWVDPSVTSRPASQSYSPPRHMSFPIPPPRFFEESPGPKPTSACARCKSLKVICEFRNGSDACKRCTSAGKECVVPGRESCHAPPGGRERVLSQIREQAKQIQELMAEIEASPDTTQYALLPRSIMCSSKPSVPDVEARDLGWVLKKCSFAEIDHGSRTIEAVGTVVPTMAEHERQEEDGMQPRGQRNDDSHGGRPVGGGVELFDLGGSLSITGPDDSLAVADDQSNNGMPDFRFALVRELWRQSAQLHRRFSGGLWVDTEQGAAADVENDCDVEGDEEDDNQEVVTEEQKMEEGKRMFSIFAARMFEQRALQGYRQIVAQKSLQQLLRELEDEDELGKGRKAKKRVQNQRKRDTKKQPKLTMEEERTAEAAAIEAKQGAHEKEMRREKEEEGARRESARKAGEEEKRREVEEHIWSMFPGDLSAYISRDGKFPVAAGGYADIYQGTLRVPLIAIKVALKVVKVYSAEDNHLRKAKRLRNEIKVWTKLNHTNVLSLFGTASGFGPFPAMVCPWLENGTLTSYLERCGADLEIYEILALIHDVASGLQYLHSQSIVHGDLSGSNVLVRVNGRACISDFGLSKVLDEIGSTYTTATEKPRGTLRWAAPELLDLEDYEDAETRHCGPTTQSDAYSFGGIMLQILSGKVPYHYYSRDVQIVAAIFRGKTPARPDNPRVTDRRWEFIQRCWSPFRNVAQRPSSEEIVAFSVDDLKENSL